MILQKTIVVDAGIFSCWLLGRNLPYCNWSTWLGFKEVSRGWEWSTSEKPGRKQKSQFYNCKKLNNANKLNKFIRGLWVSDEIAVLANAWILTALETSREPGSPKPANLTLDNCGTIDGCCIVLSSYICGDLLCSNRKAIQVSCILFSITYPKF